MGFNNSGSSGGSNPWAPAQDDLMFMLDEAKRLYDEGPIEMNTDYMEKMGGFYKSIMEGDLKITPDMVQEQASEYVDPAMVQGMVDSTTQALDQSLLGVDSAAMSSGSQNSSKTAIAQGQAAAGASASLNDQMLDYYNQQIDRASGDLESQQKMYIGAGQAMGDLGGQKAQADYMNASAGWDNLNNMMGIVGSIAGMGGETYSSGSGGSFQLSDKTLKKNIEKVGEYTVEDNEPNADGKKKKKKKVGKYEYEANKEGLKKGMPEGKQIGAIAQEVKKVAPDAVKKGSDGKLRVLYDKLKG